MSIEERRRTAEEIIAYLRDKGYIKTNAEIDSRTGGVPDLHDPH